MDNSNEQFRGKPGALLQAKTDLWVEGSNGVHIRPLIKKGARFSGFLTDDAGDILIRFHSRYLVVNKEFVETPAGGPIDPYTELQTKETEASI